MTRKVFGRGSETEGRLSSFGQFCVELDVSRLNEFQLSFCVSDRLSKVVHALQNRNKPILDFAKENTIFCRSFVFFEFFVDREPRLG